MALFAGGLTALIGLRRTLWPTGGHRRRSAGRRSAGRRSTSSRLRCSARQVPPAEAPFLPPIDHHDDAMAYGPTGADAVPAREGPSADDVHTGREVFAAREVAADEHRFDVEPVPAAAVAAEPALHPVAAEPAPYPAQGEPAASSPAAAAALSPAAGVEAVLFAVAAALAGSAGQSSVGGSARRAPARHPSGGVRQRRGTESLMPGPGERTQLLPLLAGGAAAGSGATGQADAPYRQRSRPRAHPGESAIDGGPAASRFDGPPRSTVYVSRHAAEPA